VTRGGSLTVTGFSLLELRVFIFSVCVHSLTLRRINSCCLTFFFFKDFIYLFDRERELARAGTQARVWEREKQASGRAGSLMRGSIPGPWDHDLSRRQTLND